MKIYVYNSSKELLASSEGSQSVVLNLDREYQAGDFIKFELAGHSFVKISLDPNIVTSTIYTEKTHISYEIPMGEKLDAYHPQAFKGKSHQIEMTWILDESIYKRRNLALNGLDLRFKEDFYPHTDANIVTRNESVFESKNAVDGYKDTSGHGKFPYQSWGGGLRDDLEFSLFFGRQVEIDEIILYLRADYVNDHDINWESGLIEFSDGYKMPIKMLKVEGGQSYSFKARKVTWIKLNNLKREVSAAFSALIQIEVLGKDIEVLNEGEK